MLQDGQLEFQYETNSEAVDTLLALGIDLSDTFVIENAPTCGTAVAWHLFTRAERYVAVLDCVIKRCRILPGNDGAGEHPFDTEFPEYQVSSLEVMCQLDARAHVRRGHWNVRQTLTVSRKPVR